MSDKTTGEPGSEKHIDPSTPKPNEVDPGEGTTEEGTPVENPSG